MINEIERLDLSRPPPGYNPPSPHLLCRAGCGAHGLCDGPGPDAAPEDIVAAAWAHYQARRDPPGMQVDWDAVTGWGFTIAGGPRVHVAAGAADEGLQGRTGPAKAEARAASWRWHLRRLDSWNKTMEVVRAAIGEATISDVMSAELVGAALWPDILTWSDEKMASHEAQVEMAAWKAAHG